MRFGVIGQLTVLRDGLEPVPVPGAKERLLLALLASGAPGVVSVDRLLDLLWDGAPPVTARKSLQAHVVRLRSALEPDRPKGSTGRFVVRRGAGYALVVGRDALDALHIGDLTARGRARLAAGDAEEALRELSAALELWRGEPYADWPDATFADTERRRLAEVRSSAVAGLLEAELALGRHADVVPELERLVAEEPLREGWWGLLMLALYRDGRQGDALAAGRRVRALLAEELGSDPGPGLRRLETAILAQDPSLDTPTAGSGSGSAREQPRDGPMAGAGSCPYKGLAAYQVEDAPLFRGRQRLVAVLVSRLVDAPVLVVSGPSGAGKSSVVRAGLVPALTAGALPGSQAWQPIILTPGLRPVDELAGLTGESPPPVPVVLVCDQMEELWAPGNDPAERTAFLDAVLGLLDDGVIARCVAIIRGDHVGRLAEHADFTERLGGALVLVPPLTDPELREVVTEPARSVGLSAEPDLLDVVVSDVLGQAAALPLLSTALVGTWERRRGERLTFAGYLEAGGVEGALTRSAEAAYAALGEDGQRAAQQVLVRLADSDRSGVLVRRAVPMGELDLDGEGGQVRRTIVDTFVGRRLLAVDEGRLEVAHEALLTSWPRLARWLEDDAAGRAVRRHLTPAALEWQQGGRPADELYRGARLGAALDWAAVAGADLTPLEREFLDASRAQADADLRNARMRERRTRRLAVGLAGVLAVALLAAGLAVRYQRDAAARADEAMAASTAADANRLAALSTTVGSLDLSLLLAAQAVRTANTPETQDGLLAALVEHRRAVQIAPLGGRAWDATVTGSGRKLFVTIPGAAPSLVAWPVGARTQAQTVVDDVWPDDIDASPTEDLVAASYNSYDPEAPRLEVRAADGSQRLALDSSDLGGLRPLDVAFSPDGRRLLLVLSNDIEPDDRDGVRGTVRELDLSSRKWRTIVVAEQSTSAAVKLEAAFADDASAVVVWTVEPQPEATLVDLQQGSRTRLGLARRASANASFVALPAGVAQLWDDGGVTLYDRGGREVQTLDVHQARVRDVLVAPAGTWAATAGKDGTVVLWTVPPSTGHWSRRETLTGHTGEIAGIELDPTGRILFTAESDGRVIAWDVTPDARLGFGSPYPGLGDRWISNRPQLVGHDNLLVAPTRPVSKSGGRGGIEAQDTGDVAATFLDAATGRVVDEVHAGTTLDGVNFGSSVAVSPDGRKVAVTSGYATTVLDTRTREVLGKVTLPTIGMTENIRGRERHNVPEHVWGAQWTRDGARLLLGVHSGLVVVDPSTWRVERRVEVGGAVQTIEPSPDGRLLAVASAYGPEVWLLDAATFETVHTVRLTERETPFDLSFSPNGRWLATGGDVGLVSVFDTVTWRPLHEPVKVDNDFVQQVEWLPDSRTVIASGPAGAVSLYDTPRGVIRGRPLPASGEPGDGFTYVIPGAGAELVVLAGERPGRRYPMDPSIWLAEACVVVGERDLTQAEWSRYLPNQQRRPTCSDLP